MIWKFHFGRGSLLWIVGIAFGLGVGIRGTQLLMHGNPVSRIGVVTNTSETEALHRRADSIMWARQERADAPINVNTASSVELRRLNGIGPVLAARIIEYRDKHGPFQSVEDLDHVSGIGPKRLAAIRDRCVIAFSE